MEADTQGRVAYACYTIELSHSTLTLACLISHNYNTMLDASF